MGQAWSLYAGPGSQQPSLGRLLLEGLTAPPPVCTTQGHLLPVDTRTADEGASTDGEPASAPDRQQHLEVVPAAQLLRLRTLAEAMLRSGDHTCFKVS